MKLMDIDSEHLSIPDSEYQAIVRLFISDSFSSPATNPNPNRFQFRALSGKTAITFAYEVGLRRSLARWKANEKLHLKIAKTSSTPFRRAFRILPCRCETFENDENN